MIEKATLEEIPIITRLAKQFETFTAHVKVDIEHSIKTYTNLVKSGVGVMLALKIAGEIVGALGAIKAPDLHTGHMMGIECFWFVDPSHRGQGLRLMAAFEEWAKGEGCVKTAMIHMADSYPDSLEKIYRRKGYVLTEKHYIKEL